MTPKETLRGDIKKILKGMDRKEFGIEGADAAVILYPSPLWSAYKTIFLFLSMNDEIDTKPLLEMSLRDGKKIFAPGVDKKSGALVFYRVSSPGGPWQEGPFGIREPLNESEKAAAGDFPALVITPGLAFDRKGNRLGRGRGYYDRFFAGLDAAGREYTALGLCMEAQLSAQVPAGARDKKMDGILTGKELISFSSQA